MAVVSGMTPKKIQELDTALYTNTVKYFHDHFNVELDSTVSEQRRQLEEITGTLKSQLGEVSTAGVAAINAGKSEVKASETKAKLSAEAAKTSETNARLSAESAKTSETNARESANRAENSKNTLAASVETVKESEAASLEYKNLANDSAEAAKLSEQKAAEYKSQAESYAEQAKTGAPSGGWTRESLSSDIQEALAKADNAGSDDHTHTSVDITDGTDTLSQGNRGKIVKVGASGHLSDDSDPTDNNHLVRKKYVDDRMANKANASHTHTTSQITGLDTALSNKANASHTHTLTQISNAPNSHSATPAASSLMSRDTAGRSQVNAPSAENDIANKSYVDSAVAGVSVDTSGLVQQSEVSTSGTANTVVRRTTQGFIESAKNPWHADHLTTKQYVDDRTPEIKIVSALPSNPNANTIYIVR